MYLLCNFMTGMKRRKDMMGNSRNEVALLQRIFGHALIYLYRPLRNALPGKLF